jgi:RNA polymerase sigma-70 factor (ECF subfamily)
VGIRVRFTAGSFASSATRLPPKTSPSKPFGASIARARFDPTRSFGAWARRIATNAALDHLKTARPQADLPDDLSSPTLPDPSISEELRRKIACAFRRLPPQLQVAATLALIEEQPYQEIADALVVSTGAVKVRVFRARRFLRKELKRQGIEP